MKFGSETSSIFARTVSAGRDFAGDLRRVFTAKDKAVENPESAINEKERKNLETWTQSGSFRAVEEIVRYAWQGNNKKLLQAADKVIRLMGKHAYESDKYYLVTSEILSLENQAKSPENFRMDLGKLKGFPLRAGIFGDGYIIEVGEYGEGYTTYGKEYPPEILEAIVTSPKTARRFSRSDNSGVFTSETVESEGSFMEVGCKVVQYTRTHQASRFCGGLNLILEDEKSVADLVTKLSSGKNFEPANQAQPSFVIEYLQRIKQWKKEQYNIDEAVTENPAAPEEMVDRVKAECKKFLRPAILEFLDKLDDIAAAENLLLPVDFDRESFESVPGDKVSSYSKNFIKNLVARELRQKTGRDLNDSKNTEQDYLAKRVGAAYYEYINEGKNQKQWDEFRLQCSKFNLSPDYLAGRLEPFTNFIKAKQALQHAVEKIVLSLDIFPHSNYFNFSDSNYKFSASVQGAVNYGKTIYACPQRLLLLSVINLSFSQIYRSRYEEYEPTHEEFAPISNTLQKFNAENPEISYSKTLDRICHDEFDENGNWEKDDFLSFYAYSSNLSLPVKNLEEDLAELIVELLRVKPQDT